MTVFANAISYFHKGGLVMWPLLFCSLAVISIAIERYLYYRTIAADTTFANNYCQLLNEDRTAEAEGLAESSQGTFPQLLVNASKLKGSQQMKEAFMATQSNILIARIREKLDYLSIIVTMSPLLGLLGTIVGMIGAFSIFNLKEGAPLAITGGIGEALIATATGLCVAIMALIAHSYLSHRVDGMITNMEQCFSTLIEAEVRGGK